MVRRRSCRRARRVGRVVGLNGARFETRCFGLAESVKTVQCRICTPSLSLRKRGLP